MWQILYPFFSHRNSEIPLKALLDEEGWPKGPMMFDGQHFARFCPVLLVPSIDVSLCSPLFDAITLSTSSDTSYTLPSFSYSNMYILFHSWGRNQKHLETAVKRESPSLRGS